MHYWRWHTHGDPLYSVQRPAVCTIDGCDREVDAAGLCVSHYYRLGSTATRSVVAPCCLNSELDYFHLHARLRKVRGSARGYQCVRCDRTASEWAWLHGEDPSEFDSYTPMCRSCHRKYDMTPETREKNRRAATRGWTPERRAAQSRKSKEAWVRRKRAQQESPPAVA